MSGKRAVQPIEVLKRLVGKAQLYCLRSRGVDYAYKTERERDDDSKEVGQLVLCSDVSSRALLEALTSSDVANVRWPEHDYVHYLVNHKTKEVKPDPNYRYNRRRKRCITLS